MKKLFIMIAMVLGSLTASAQFEDTTSTFNIVGDEQLINDQLFKSFRERQIGMLPFLVADSVDYILVLSPQEIMHECMPRAKAVQNIEQFYNTMPYQGFRMFSGDMVEGPVIFMKVYMDINNPEMVIHFFFGFDPGTHKINKILVE